MGQTTRPGRFNVEWRSDKEYCKMELLMGVQSLLKRDKALAVIVLSVNPPLLYLIGDPTDPCVVRKKLALKRKPGQLNLIYVV